MRTPRTIVYHGRRIPLTEAARLSQRPYATLRWRLDNGWSDAAALGEEPGERKRVISRAIAHYLEAHPEEAKRYA